MEELNTPSGRPRIISASRRTDIPAFYGEWFMRRIREGWAVSFNPFSRRPFRVSLLHSDVAAIVFWSKNFGPFLPHLAVLAGQGYNMVFLYTITGLPRLFKAGVPDAEQALPFLRQFPGCFRAGMFSGAMIRSC